MDFKPPFQAMSIRFGFGGRRLTDSVRRLTVQVSLRQPISHDGRQLAVRNLSHPTSK
jgi:hypothetical protein